MMIEGYRVCVYVPQDVLEGFIAAVSPHIPSFLGSYDHVCWWSAAGFEQSRKMPDGAVQVVACHKFECSLPKDEAGLIRYIDEIVRPNHPWEEPVVTITEQKIANFGEI